MAPSTRRIIITGPPASGKTPLHQLLTTSNVPDLTVTSSEPVNSILKLDEEYNHSTFQNVQVWDYPGSTKLKNLYLYPNIKSQLNEIIGLIYMLDASTFNDAKVKEVANDLIRIFKVTESRPNGVDLLVLCNKADLFTSKKSQRIKQLLEDAIDALLKLDTNQLEKVDADESGEGGDIQEDLFITKGDKFKFADLEGNVTFEECNIWKQGKRENVYDWVLEKIANN